MAKWTKLRLQCRSLQQRDMSVVNVTTDGVAQFYDVIHYDVIRYLFLYK